MGRTGWWAVTLSAYQPEREESRLYITNPGYTPLDKTLETANMTSKRVSTFWGVLLLISLWFIGGCAFPDLIKPNQPTDPYYKPAKTVASYEDAGKWWGTRHKTMKVTAGQIDPAFVDNLIDKARLDFFWVHSDLKDAFKKGYRLGYEERTADLVLGPHLTQAASRIGTNTSQSFVDVITAFETGWALTLKNAVDVFIVLISEGSQADRENFIGNFTAVYTRKYEATQAFLRGPGLMRLNSEGGTMLYIDVRKTIAVLDIPTPMLIKTEIYHQTFRVMGDEWGRRFSTNLIKRDELIDVLRRSKTALQEVPESLESNLDLIQGAFVSSYGTDADNVFTGLRRDAGYTTRPTSMAPPGPPASPAPSGSPPSAPRPSAPPPRKK